MNYFLDTNIFIRFFVIDKTSTYQDCKMLLEKIKQGSENFYTSSLVLSEVNWVLLSFYHFPKTNILEALKSIVNLKTMKFIEPYDYNTALFQYERYSVKFIDTMIASIPKIASQKMAVISYDKDFDKLGVKRLEPGAVLARLSEQ